jgi:hypothetical protein
MKEKGRRYRKKPRPAFWLTLALSSYLVLVRNGTSGEDKVGSSTQDSLKEKKNVGRSSQEGVKGHIREPNY